MGGCLSSWSVIAHSQGGNAMLHLYANYYSGLDHSEGRGAQDNSALSMSEQTAGEGRLIQSVGSPYQGTPIMDAAGHLPSRWLPDLYYGSTYVHDLSLDGAAQWLSTIPGSARNHVTYS